MPSTEALDTTFENFVEKISPSETFIVITSRFGKRHVHVLNKAKSFYIFGQNHPVRKFALYITTNQYPLIQKKDKGQLKNVRIEFCQQVTEALII
ncbi:hypothetical protein P5673_028432 [Acropora cervicornis]|uniref:Uncharacterized protein n=1 Tax=Acropora cervicornis TaxID=6130 RepID=A0AAD9UUT7_ACRCE|nr:hypothetical protein P5673_028432 [Acropora cervicornis]